MKSKVAILAKFVQNTINKKMGKFKSINFDDLYSIVTNPKQFYELISNRKDLMCFIQSVSDHYCKLYNRNSRYIVCSNDHEHEKTSIEDTTNVTISLRSHLIDIFNYAKNSLNASYPIILFSNLIYQIEFHDINDLARNYEEGSYYFRTINDDATIIAAATLYLEQRKRIITSSYKKLEEPVPFDVKQNAMIYGYFGRQESNKLPWVSYAKIQVCKQLLLGLNKTKNPMLLGAFAQYKNENSVQTKDFSISKQIYEFDQIANECERLDVTHHIKNLNASLKNQGKLCNKQIMLKPNLYEKANALKAKLSYGEKNADKELVKEYNLLIDEINKQVETENTIIENCYKSFANVCEIDLQSKEATVAKNLFNESAEIIKNIIQTKYNFSQETGKADKHKK